MRLKLYWAATVAEAMAQVRADLGPEALIVSTRRTADGVELTAALDPVDEPIPQAAPPANDLAYHGVPASIVSRLAGPDLAVALAGVLRFGKLPLSTRTDGAEARGTSRPLLLAGLPGAGKTLSIARIATRLVLAGIRPAVITADGRRAGAAEELAAYTRLLGLELMVAGTPATLARALTAPPCRTGAPVLIDTSGIDPFAPGDIATLADLVQVACAAPVLVMAAGQHPDEAAEQALAFAPLGIQHLLPTRFDLARRLGSVIAAASAADLILTEAGTGSCATGALVQITPAYLAGRLSRLNDRPLAPRVPEPAALRRPVFPSARTREADSWSIERHG